ncbi:MAG: TIGR03790 family protein [Planctomycetota bacterium]
MTARNNPLMRLDLFFICVALLALAAALPAPAGGSPENLLLIIDPTNHETLYLGNYYRNARNVPARNVIYMAPGAVNYAAFVDTNLEALFGTLANAGIEDHIDYIVIMPGDMFFVSAPGYITDGCATVSRFSISSAYTMAFITDEILAGGLPSSTLNRYFNVNAACAFDSSVSWLGGYPSESANARRYFIGTLLGYTGERGNTPDEIIAMIDRSVASDGTRPTGTFYFMNTTDPLRNVRAFQFTGAVSAIQSLGGQAEIIDGVLPTGRHDCLGILTGVASPPIDTADMTILPGAFCDHLTSYAATFDTTSQVKLSRWIANGASGSWGATQEPCNYIGKFPHARLHSLYLEGSSLGEAGLRSALYTPFQMLLYGDPMTRPFAHIPTVTVDDAPGEPASGTILLTPAATTSHPTATIAQYDLLIDGVLYDSIAPDESFIVDTIELADGWHDLRVLATDDTPVGSTGRWTGALTVDNRGRAASLDVSEYSGNRSTPFVCDIVASGGPVREVCAVQNGRVLAAAVGPVATLTVYGLTLGAGPVRVQAEALFHDGRIVRSAPVGLDIEPVDDTSSGQPPVAYGFTKRVLSDTPVLVELPASFDDIDDPLTFEILSEPAQATIAGGQTGPYRLLRPLPGAAGTDSFTFRATSSVGDSNTATVKLIYDWWFGDMNCDGIINAYDIDGFLLAVSGYPDFDEYHALYPDCDPMLADINGDTIVNAYDIDGFIALVGG